MKLTSKQQQPVMRVETKVSVYERVSGSLSSGIIVLGVVTLVLLIIWGSLLTESQLAKTDISTTINGETLNPVGVAEDIEEPGVEEFPEVAEPMLAEALDAVDVASSVVATNEAGDAIDIGAGRGLGDFRLPGLPGPWKEQQETEPWKRWQIDYTVSSMQQYAQQLDYFGIELGGAATKGDSVVYCSNVATGGGSLRAGLKRTEQRIYFQHAKPMLRSWDLRLLRDAGAKDAAERLPLHFYPQSLVQKMYQMEAEQLEVDKRKANEIKQTRFVVTGTAGDYHLALQELEYLN